MEPSSIKKLHREFTDIIRNPIEGLVLKPLDERISSFKAILDGPDKFKFHLRLLCFDYPQLPHVYFQTRVLHPSVLANGQVCLDVFWDMEDVELRQVLLKVRSLVPHLQVDKSLSRNSTPIKRKIISSESKLKQFKH